MTPRTARMYRHRGSTDTSGTSTAPRRCCGLHPISQPPTTSWASIPAEVRDVLWSDWPRWTDPSTTTDEMLATLGLPSVGAPAGEPDGTRACR